VKYSVHHCTGVLISVKVQMDWLYCINRKLCPRTKRAWCRAM